MKKTIIVIIGMVMASALGASPIRTVMAARTTATSEETSGWKNPYITDGLIAMWDGEWNAGPGMHDPNATVCVDLVNNGYDLILANCTIEQNCFFVNAHKGAYSSKGFTTLPLSFKACVSRVAKNDYLFTSVGIGFVYASRKFQMVNYKRTNNAVEAPTAWANNEIINFCATYNNQLDLLEFTLNGEISLPVISENNTWLQNSHAIEFGSNASYWGSIRIYNIAFYSRILTPAEIQHNYLVDKERFGLP